MRTLRKTMMFVALGAMLVPATLSAQDVMVGVKGGINVADLSVDADGEEFSSDTKTGLVAGLFAEFGISDMFAVRPEGLYSQKGFKTQDTGIDLELNLDYIEVPVLLVARLGESSIRPVVFAGPVIAFEASCKLEGESEGVTLDVDCSEAPDDPIETSSTDFGAAFGGGLEIDAGGVTLLFDGRYTLGLKDVESSSESSAKNRAWSFMAGAGIAIG